jgi:hypothetical protein
MRINLFICVIQKSLNTRSILSQPSQASVYVKKLLVTVIVLSVVYVNLV